MAALTNEMKLEQMAKNRETALVTGDEKIAVFGAGGQVGTKLKPLLERIYPGKVIFCEAPAIAEKKGMVPLDISDESALRAFLTDKKNNVKVVINLAALLSGAADQYPDLAHKINFKIPRKIVDIMDEMDEAHRKWEKDKQGEEPHTLRKVQVMSSMASQEFMPEPDDGADVVAAKQTLQSNSSTKARFPAKSKYGRQKGSIEMDADYFVSQRGLDISVPCLAGVLNAHTPWPSDGTTEELDKMIVAAALHKVYGDEWEAKLRELIIAQDPKNIEKLNKGHYIHDGKYVPEVTGDTKFAMIDGRTLAETVLLLLHHDSRKSGPVQNVYEYTSTMSNAGMILKELNPDFPLEFAQMERDLSRMPAGIVEPATLMECVDEGKMKRAQFWAHGMDTSITESVIGKFKSFNEKQSIRDQYNRAVEFFKTMRESEMSVTPAAREAGPAAVGA